MKYIENSFTFIKLLLYLYKFIKVKSGDKNKNIHNLSFNVDYSLSNSIYIKKIIVLYNYNYESQNYIMFK